MNNGLRKDVVIKINSKPLIVISRVREICESVCGFKEICEHKKI